MTDSEKIITAARRYCIEQSNFWRDKYAKEGSVKGFANTFTQQDYDLFPRYNALDAILKGVERIVETEFSSLTEGKEILTEIARSAQTLFTRRLSNETEKMAIQDERHKFIDFIGGFSEASLHDIQPLPYRRLLSKTESDIVRQRLADEWEFSGVYWVPLASCDKQPALFFSKSSLSEDDFHSIKEVFTNNTQRAYELQIVEGWDYEIDVSEFDADCYETFYIDKEFSRVVYGSHEGTIAFGGKSFVEKITEVLKHRKSAMNKWTEH